MKSYIPVQFLHLLPNFLHLSQSHLLACKEKWLQVQYSRTEFSVLILNSVGYVEIKTDTGEYSVKLPSSKFVRLEKTKKISSFEVADSLELGLTSVTMF